MVKKIWGYATRFDKIHERNRRIDGQTDRQTPHYGVGHSCIAKRCKNCEQDILETNVPILMQIGTRRPRVKGMKRSTLEVRRSKVKVTQGRR